MANEEISKAVEYLAQNADKFSGFIDLEIESDQEFLDAVRSLDESTRRAVTALAGLSDEERKRYLDQLSTQVGDEYGQYVAALVQRVRVAIRRGQERYPAVFDNRYRYKDCTIDPYYALGARRVRARFIYDFAGDEIKPAWFDQDAEDAILLAMDTLELLDSVLQSAADQGLSPSSGLDSGRVRELLDRSETAIRSLRSRFSEEGE